jgi:thiosulfate dehydrogenase (quinone) large subunit
MASTKKPKEVTFAKHVATLRIIFGVMWAFDATFKWSPAFRNGFLGHIQSAADGQPHWLGWWFHFWPHFLAHNPHLFAILIAVAESLIAFTLLIGLARRATYLAAAVFSLLIWAIPEGFGGPYTVTATDIGTGIIYAVVFFALYGLERLAVPPKWSADTYICKRVPWWAWLANP